MLMVWTLKLTSLASVASYVASQTLINIEVRFGGHGNRTAQVWSYWTIQPSYSYRNKRCSWLSCVEGRLDKTSPPTTQEITITTITFIGGLILLGQLPLVIMLLP